MVQGGVQAYVEQALEDLGHNEEPVIVQQVNAAEPNVVTASQALPIETAIDSVAVQEPQRSSLALFEFDKEPLPAPSREDLFPTKPPRANFSKTLPKELDSSLKIMERNNNFQPVTAHQGKILDFVENSVRDQSAISSTIEHQQQYAFDLVRKQYGENASVGITPFFAVKASSAAARPGLSKAATETQFMAGVNLAQINSPKFKLGIDAARADVLFSTETTARTTVDLKVVPKISSSVSVKASALAATAEVGPVKIPFAGVECTSSVQASLLSYDSTSIVPTSLTRVNVSTTCAAVISQEQSVKLRASLRP